jgi:hypothetical protein
VSKQTTQFIWRGSVLKRLIEIEGNEQYRVEISDGFSALENFDAKVDINRACETITREFQPKGI